MYKKNVFIHFSSSSSLFSARVALLCTFWLLFWPSRMVCCTERVQGKVRPSQVQWEKGDRPTSRDAEPRANPLPSSLEVELRLGARDVHLHLAKDRGFNLQQLPVYVLCTDSEGRLHSHPAPLNDTEFAVYQDVQNEAAFGVFREKYENGAWHYKLQGIAHSDGRVYSLKSKGQRVRSGNINSSHRHRRHALDDDIDNNKNVNGSRPDDDGDDDGDDGKEEFEVEVISDPMVDGADSLPVPSGLKQHIKKLKRTEDPLDFPSAPSSPFNPLPPPHKTPPSPQRRRGEGWTRRKRQGILHVNVDVVAVVDYGVYKAWYGRSSGATTTLKKQDTLETIRLYYAIVMNGVNLLYKTITSVYYKINVRLVSILVSSTAATAQWTERYRVPAQGGARWDTVDIETALEALGSWVGTTDALPAYDHVMLFSGYDLSTGANESLKTDIVGLAWMNTVCLTGGQAVSIVEDLGGFQSIRTAAHELGHGLSAVHDGEGNACRSEDRYIMASSTFPATRQNKLNPWRFSSCSMNSFWTFILLTLLSPRGQQCLNTALIVDGKLPAVTSVMPGQLYDPDQQCRQVYGPQSRLCRGVEFAQAWEICTSMYCLDPSTTSTCLGLVAARGTTCGNQRWCQSGQCVYDVAAAVVDDSCVHGDQPGVVFQGQDCQTVVRDLPGLCYRPALRQICCASCAKRSLFLRGCEYGDRARDCSSSVCPFAAREYLADCCGTCNYGTPFTPTRPTSVSGPTSVSCLDNPTFSLAQMTSCLHIVEQQPELCYDATAFSQCCGSCHRVSSGITGCEYGDRDPLRCREAGGTRTRLACGALRHLCCQTCASDSSTSTRLSSPSQLLATHLGIPSSSSSSHLLLYFLALFSLASFYIRWY